MNKRISAGLGRIRSLFGDPQAVTETLTEPDRTRRTLLLGGAALAAGGLLAGVPAPATAGGRWDDDDWDRHRWRGDDGWRRRRRRHRGRWDDGHRHRHRRRRRRRHRRGNCIHFEFGRFCFH